MEQSLLKKIAQKYIKGEPHKRVSDLELKVLLGPSYQEEIVATTPYDRSVTKMVEKVKKVSWFYSLILNLSVLLKSCCE